MIAQRLQRGERIEYLDFARGFAVCLVVLGHCIQYGSGSDFLYNADYFADPLFQGIYSFHMPLFALISGCLFRGTVVKYGFLQNVGRQALRLLLPVVCWTIAYEIFFQVIGGSPLRGPASPNWISMLPQTILDSHWFFWGVFWCSVIILLVNRWASDRVWVYGLLCLLLPLLPDQFLVRDFYLYAYIFPYFVLGYLAGRFDFKKVQRKTWYIAAVVLLVVFVLLLFRYSKSAFIYTTKLSVWKGNPIKQIVIDGFRWVIGLVGSMLALLVMHSVWRICHDRLAKMNKAICFFGKNSAGIYIISTYLNFEVLVRVCRNFSPNYLVHLLLSVCILAVCSGAVWALEHFRITRLLALGKR